MRQLRASPAFTIVILLTLALSIGANSAIFSVINGVLLKRLPYEQPDRLVRMFLSSSSYPKFPFNPFDFLDFRARNQSFESMAAFNRGDVQLSGSGEPVRLYGFGITSGYFHVLGLRPQLGREFDRPAEIPGNGLQVILSDRLWRTRFGADPDIIGRKLTLNQQPFTVIGVMPPGTVHPGNEYHALPYGEDVDVWWPFSFAGDPNHRGSHFIEVIARLKDGVSISQAKGEMNTIMQQLAREHPNNDAGWSVLVIPLYNEVVGSSRQMLLVLLGAVMIVLLIACANAANLLLARASSRQREIAVRLAMGAPRRRIIRQLMTESLLISFLGGGLGLALAYGGVKALVSLLPADFPRAQDIHVSAPVLAFTILVTVVTGLLFGVAPALQAAGADPQAGPAEGRALHHRQRAAEPAARCAGSRRSKPGVRAAHRRGSDAAQPPEPVARRSRLPTGACAHREPFAAARQVQQRRAGRPLLRSACHESECAARRRERRRRHRSSLDRLRRKCGRIHHRRKDAAAGAGISRALSHGHAGVFQRAGNSAGRGPLLHRSGQERRAADCHHQSRHGQ